eukprot:TRINITY_DN2058_c0_g2_i2.p1 TRINITY_DN2058_c0_g2~~TRINITY_DN2058_c0_g2_i2.p1  ORF type:complete len:322 (+),score=37.63 TRINITY_DN2058_c0_g2_i2:3-968(+)
MCIRDRYQRRVHGEQQKIDTQKFYILMRNPQLVTLTLSVLLASILAQESKPLILDSYLTLNDENLVNPSELKISTNSIGASTIYVSVIKGSNPTFPTLSVVQTERAAISQYETKKIRHYRLEDGPNKGSITLNVAKSDAKTSGTTTVRATIREVILLTNNDEYVGETKLHDEDIFEIYLPNESFVEEEAQAVISVNALQGGVSLFFGNSYEEVRGKEWRKEEKQTPGEMIKSNFMTDIEISFFRQVHVDGGAYREERTFALFLCESRRAGCVQIWRDEDWTQSEHDRCLQNTRDAVFEIYQPWECHCQSWLRQKNYLQASS